MNIRSILAGSPLPSLFSVEALASMSSKNFILPFYHIVSDEDCPHIKNLYRVKSSKEFETDLDFLLQYYQPIAAKDLPDVITGKYHDKKIFLLTFDDGLRECYDVIAPILLRKGIPATFFINSAFVDNRALMFRYKVSLLLNELKSQSIKSQLLQQRKDSSFIESIAEEINFSFEQFLQKETPYLTSEQIKSLVSKGFTMAAHSVDHPYYEDLNLKNQLQQTLSSLQFLQQKFGIQEKLFAFPFTDYNVSKSFFDEIYRENKIDFSFGGAGMKADISPRHFQRIAMESPAASAEQLIRAEYLYYLFKKPFGKNKIDRV